MSLSTKPAVAVSSPVSVAVAVAVAEVDPDSEPDSSALSPVTVLGLVVEVLESEPASSPQAEARATQEIPRINKERWNISVSSFAAAGQSPTR
jgi:hypothetical protein